MANGGGGQAAYSSLSQAVSSIQNQGTDPTTITLQENAENPTEEGIFLEAGSRNIVIDLNGKTLTINSPVGSEGTKTQAFYLGEGNTVTIKNGTLNVPSENTAIKMLIQNYCNLTLDDVTLNGINLDHSPSTPARYVLSNNCGTINLTGNTTIIAKAGDFAFDVCKLDKYNEPNVTWESTGYVDGIVELSGGTLTVPKEATLNLTMPIKAIAKAKLVVNGTIQPFSSKESPEETTNWDGGDALVIVKRNGDLTITGSGKITNNDNTNVHAAVKMTEKGETGTGDHAKLTVGTEDETGPTLTGDYYGITGNGSRHDTEITINGGTIQGTHDKDNLGIFHPQEGTLTINGGTIKGYSSAVEMRAGTLNITGGELEATAESFSCNANGSGNTTVGAALAIAQHTTQKDINVTISGGTFKGVKALNESNPQGNTNPNITLSVTGGTFDGEISTEDVSGFIDKNSTATFSDLSGVNVLAEGATYKLTDDVTLNEPLDITSGKTITIDLGGKTIIGRINIKHGNVTFQNGYIRGYAEKTENELTENEKKVQPLNVYGSANSTDNLYSTLTIEESVTVTAGIYGVCLFGATATTTGYGAVANIAGTINTEGDGKNGAVFVSGNLGKNLDTDFAVSQTNAINIQSTAIITSNSDAALALNGSATVTIEEGATLTGNTAIAAKRGKLIVNGGKIVGNGTLNSNPGGNNSGTEMTGAALSATGTYLTGGPLSVEINDGTFISRAYTILNNHSACDFDIKGGTFETTMTDDQDKTMGGIAVYARLGGVKISGGTFTNTSNYEATLHAGCPTAAETYNTEGNNKVLLTISGNPVVKNNASDNYVYNTALKPLTVNMANGLTYKAVSISGGTFYGEDPSKDDSYTTEAEYKNFLKEGYAAVQCKDEDDKTYFEIIEVGTGAPTELYYFAGSNEKQEKKTPADFLNAKKTAKNAIAFVSSESKDWAATQTNVVVEYTVGSGSGKYYECPNFVLDDNADFYTPVDFVALKGSYTRTDTKGLNSVCLPFEISESDMNNGKIGVFHSTDMYNGTSLKNSGTVYFNEVDQVPAGTPCIVECSSEDEDTDWNWNIKWGDDDEEDYRTIKASVNNEHALKGAYLQSTETVFEGKYKVASNGDKFCKMTTNNKTLYPFRAYLDLNYDSTMGTEEGNTGNGVKEFNIAWTDDANAIESVKKVSEDNVLYDLSGRMVKNPAKGGLYIMNGKKMIIK